MGNPAIQTFGKYQILERIATGGMAEIYKARLEGIGGFQRTFAIKRILPNLSQNSDYIAMLVDEAKVAGLLSHANIVQILDLGQVDGVWYIAMEYVEGPDLGAVLRRAGEKGLTLPVPHSVFIAIELLKGLEYAHQRQVMRGGRPVPLNIIHRDVSPPNILLSYQGEVKLTDFGIARATLRAMETVSGIVKGRFDYMSPEQAAGAKDLDQRSDLFAVGVVLYQMLTGTHPFRADNELATVERVRQGTYEPVSERNPEVPFSLETIVDRALRVDREERYPTATAFKEALDKFFHDSGFIFTHATLSSYLKGLFPKAAPQKKSKRREAAVVRGGSSGDDLDAGEVLDDTEFPTRVLDQQQVAREMEALRQNSGFGLKASDPDRTAVNRPNPLLENLDTASEADEQPTVVHEAMPNEWDDDVATVVRKEDQEGGGSDWDDQQATAIRPSPFEDSKPRPAPEILDHVDEEASTEHSADNVLDTVERTITGQVDKGGTSWLLVLATSFVTGLIGVIIGAVFGGSLIAVIGLNTGGSDQASLRVEAPPRTAVSVDGDMSPRQQTLAPGLHQVEITVPEHQPWSTEVELEPGEQLVIQVATPTPEPTPEPEE